MVVFSVQDGESTREEETIFSMMQDRRAHMQDLYEHKPVYGERNRAHIKVGHRILEE